MHRAVSNEVQRIKIQFQLSFQNEFKLPFSVFMSNRINDCKMVDFIRILPSNQNAANLNFYVQKKICKY